MGTHPIFESDFTYFTDKKTPTCLAPPHVALVPSSYSKCSAKELHSICLWLHKRGCRKITIWDLESRLAKHRQLNWDELNCRLMTGRQGAVMTNSIKQMRDEQFTPSELTLDLLDQFIGPNGEEPQLLLSVGTSSKLISTDGYPPWALRLTSMYPFPAPYSDTALNDILYKYSHVKHRNGQ